MLASGVFLKRYPYTTRRIRADDWLWELRWLSTKPVAVTELP